MKDTLRKYDVAYGCFLFCGVVVLFLNSLYYVFAIDEETAIYLAVVVAIPLTMVSLGVMVVGIGFSIWLYHHWPLVVLSLLSVLFIAEVFTEYGPVLFIADIFMFTGYGPALYDAAPILYGLSACGFSLRWFLFLRKRWGKND